MSSPPAAAAADAPPKGKKKLIIIIAVVAVVLAGGGGAAVMMMKKSDAEAEADGEGGAPKAKPKVVKKDPKAVPTFAQLDNFTVNLADRDVERYAQVGITLELEDGTSADQIKTFMPAIRNNILLAISDRTASELQDREGKEKLAKKIKRETSRALGVEVEDEEEEEPAASEKAGDKKPTRKKRREEQVLPVRNVHFSNFIIQ